MMSGADGVARFGEARWRELCQRISEGLSQFDDHEALDRAHTVQIMLHELLGDHAVVVADNDVLMQFDKAAEAIAELYQLIDRRNGG